MKKTLLSFVVLVGLVGCGAAPEVPTEKVERQQLTSPKSIVLYSQRLQPSSELAKKAFTIKTYSGKLTTSSEIEGVESTTAFDLKKPLHLYYDFKKPSIIYQADVYDLNIHLVDDTMVGHSIVTDIKKISIYYDDKQKKSVTLQQTQNTIHGFRKKATTSLDIDIHSFFTENNLLTERKFKLSKSDVNITFSFFNPEYVNDILIETLQTRENQKKNEALLHSIVKSDISYYYKLRQQRGSFILDKQSIVNMPDDADLEYAQKNYKDFFESGKYLTEEGKYKILIADEVIKFENSEVKIEKQHTIKDKYSKQHIKKTTDIPDHDGFIDFSEGVE